MHDSLDTNMKAISATLGSRSGTLVRDLADHWVETGKELPDVYKEHGVKSFSRYYGQHITADDSLFSFLSTKFLERWSKENSVFLRDYNISIGLRPPAPRESHVADRGFLVWEERTEYTFVVCQANRSIKVPVKQFVSQRVLGAHFQEYLKHYQMSYAFNNGIVFDLSKSLQAMGDSEKRTLLETGSWGNGPFSIGYSNENLSLKYEDEHAIGDKGFAPAFGHELGFIDPAVEDHYVLRLTYPANRMRIIINIDPRTGYKIQEYSMGVDRYDAGAISCDPANPIGEDGMIRFSFGDWVLPGLAFFFVWGKPTSSS